MANVRRILVTAGVAIVGVAAATAAVVYGVSARSLGKKYQVPTFSIAIPSDSVAVARGRHLVQAVGPCATCHAGDLGGRVYADMGPVGVVAGPNLTRGPGGWVQRSATPIG